MAIQSETELYLPIKHYFEQLGYEVKSEVKDCDLVACHEEQAEPVIVELKRTFNLALLHQGIERQRLSSQVYVAVQLVRGQRRPVHLRWSNLRRLCEKLGLGLITVQFYKTKPPAVEVLCEPVDRSSASSRRTASRRTKKLLTEFNERSGDYNTGGSSQTKIVTAYRECALQCAYLIHKHGPLSPKQLREMTGTVKVNTILQNNFYGWFERVKRGIYQNTAKGEQALQQYDHVIQSMQNKSPYSVNSE